MVFLWFSYGFPMVSAGISFTDLDLDEDQLGGVFSWTPPAVPDRVEVRHLLRDFHGNSQGFHGDFRVISQGYEWGFYGDFPG